MKNFFYLLISFLPVLLFINTYSQVATFEWNTPNGFPYQQSYGANLGITSFCNMPDGNVAFLSNVDNKIRIFSPELNLIKEIHAGIQPIDFTFGNQSFYIADGRKINILSSDGEFLSTLKVPAEIKSVYGLKVFDALLYVLTPDQQSWLIAKNNQPVTEKIITEGWVINQSISYKTIRTGDFSWRLEQYQNNTISNIQNFSTQNKIGSVIFAGIIENSAWVDIDFITCEIPLKTDRYFYEIPVSSTISNQTAKEVQIPDVYYTQIRHDFNFSATGISFLLSTPDNAMLFEINHSKNNIFPQELFSSTYFYNDHTLPAGQFENADLNPGESKASIYRSQIIAIGQTFEEHEWTGSSNNIRNYSCGGVNVTTPAWVQVGLNRSIPYMWGGFSSLTQYETGLTNGVSAGDMTTDGGSAGSSCAVGVDCSGFVSRAWNQSTKYGTSTLPNISTAYSSYTELKPGDIVNLAGSHVRLVHTPLTNGSFLVLEATAANNAWAVTYNTYTTTAMQSAGYIPRYYNQVLDDVVNPPMLLSPVQIAQNIASPVIFDWTTVSGADSYQIQVSTTQTGWTAENGFTSSTSASATVPVNASTDTTSTFTWNDGTSGTFGIASPNTTYYWSVRVNIPGQGTSVYTNPRMFSTIGDQSLPQTDFNLNIWATSDINVHFDDFDDFQVNNRFVNLSDYNGTEWRANAQKGSFTDHFNAAIHADWTTLSGTWAISNQALVQSDEATTNPNIYAPVKQDSGSIYLYSWKMKITDNGNNNRAGIFIMCSDPTLTYRGNSYMVYFRTDDNSCQIYRGTPTDITLETDDACTVNAGTWYDYKLTYNTNTGELKAFQNDVLVSSWTDPSPVRNGIAISFRTGGSNVAYDDMLVFRSRTADEMFVVGTGGDFRYQNPDINTPSGRIMSVITDFGDNFSLATTHYQNIDWTSPDAITLVNDGTSVDEDSTGTASEINANWNATSDINSGIESYFYAVGTSPGNDDVVAWTDGGDILTSVTIPGLSLNYNITYYVSIKARNGAGLFSETTSSDGIIILGNPNVNSALVKNEINIYPNPLHIGQNITIVLNDDFSDEFNISIFDNKSTLVLSKTLKTNEKTIDLNLSGLSKGFYILTIQSASKQSVHKLLVE